jgi:hypothetical protein
MSKPPSKLRSLHYTEAEGNWELTSQDHDSQLTTSGRIGDTDFAGFCMRLFANRLVSTIEFPVLIEGVSIKEAWCWRRFKKTSHSFQTMIRINTMAELQEYIKIYYNDNSLHVIWSQNHLEYKELLEKVRIFEKEQQLLELSKAQRIIPPS